MTGTRRGGRERRGAGAQGRAGTLPKVEGDVVMAGAEENPKRRAQGQRPGRGEMGRRSTGAQAGAEGATGRRDARRIPGTASSVGQNEKLTGCSIGMGYCDGAEHRVVTDENSRRWRGAALCPSSEARCQGSALQERRTGRRIQYSDTLVPGSWLMVLRTRPRRDCWDGQVAVLVNLSPVQWSHVSVAPLWTGSRSVRAIRRLVTWRQSSLHDKMVLH